MNDQQRADFKKKEDKYNILKADLARCQKQIANLKRKGSPSVRVIIQSSLHNSGDGLDEFILDNKVTKVIAAHLALFIESRIRKIKADMEAL